MTWGDNNVQPINRARVRDPKWSGADGEYAVLVPQGWPARSREQLQEELQDQIRRYLTGFSELKGEDLDLAVSEATWAIADYYIWREGPANLRLQREQLFRTIEVAREYLAALRAEAVREDWARRQVAKAGKSWATHMAKFDGTVLPR